MDIYDSIKQEIRQIQSVGPGQSRYGLFLDRLARRRMASEDKLEVFDLEYFSLNTDFCREAAKSYQAIIRQMVSLLNKDGQIFDTTPFAVIRHSYDDLRLAHGSFTHFLSAAMDSFLHEVNLFYDLGLPRHRVKLVKVVGALKKRRSLRQHLEECQNSPIVKTFQNYRNGQVHGFIYPMQGYKNRILIGSDPKLTPFDFDQSYYDILDFCEQSLQNINHLIVQGWRCFEVDELTDEKSNKSE